MGDDDQGGLLQQTMLRTADYSTLLRARNQVASLLRVGVRTGEK